jgi:ABC-type cobalamin/Fe3+-siderophores transport system ATPase subunit
MTTRQAAHALAYVSRAVLMQDGAIIAEGHPADVVTTDR